MEGIWFLNLVKTVPGVEEVLKKAEVKKEEIRYYILHQANSKLFSLLQNV